MRDCVNQWKIDVNDRYQKAVGVVAGLSTASLILPIFYLKDIVGLGDDDSIADIITWLVYLAWGLLALSVLAAVIYYYVSAKWVKLAWGKKPDFFGKTRLFGWNMVSDKALERMLDGSYFTMMVGFIVGLFCMLVFVVNFTYREADPENTTYEFNNCAELSEDGTVPFKTYWLCKYRSMLQ